MQQKCLYPDTRHATYKLFGAYLVLALIGTLFGPTVVPVRSDVLDEIDRKYHQPIGEAVDRGLASLAAGQLPDGAFDNTHPAVGAALGVMSFLAKGYSPGIGPYGDVIDRGIDRVLESQRDDGMLAAEGNMYGHSAATLMLAEVTGMLDPQRQERVDEALGKAVKLLLDAQRINKSPQHQGGWRYQPNSNDSDMSLTGWAFMAIWAARNAGYPVPRQAIDDAVEYIMRCHREQDGGFAYMPGRGSSAPLVGIGALCLTLADRHPDEVKTAAGFIARHDIGAGRFYYNVYYSAQAMFQLGGEYWEEYAPRLYETVLARQQPDGSFSRDQDSGQAYATAMAILSLTPTFRQLPVYQR